MPQVNLPVKDIYDKLCPECQKKLIELIKDRVASEAIKKQLEGKE